MVPLHTVIRRCIGDGPIALVKIDAEGAEAGILEGADAETLKEIRQFVIEYHNSLCPGALERCERVLADAGFRCRNTRSISISTASTWRRRSFACWPRIRNPTRRRSAARRARPAAAWARCTYRAPPPGASTA